MKLFVVRFSSSLEAAAFRRLCVETIKDNRINQFQPAAAFRRLCVETLNL